MGKVVALRRPAMLRCSECGVHQEAACDCGAPYIAAKEAAARAIRRSPEKSDRAIAAEVGVSHPTVAAARRETGNILPDATRVGQDGKVRRLPKPSTSTGKVRAVDPTVVPASMEWMEEPPPETNTKEEFWQNSLGTFASHAVSLEAYWTKQFGDWRQFEPPSHLITLAEQAAEAWAKLAKELRAAAMKAPPSSASAEPTAMSCADPVKDRPKPPSISPREMSFVRAYTPLLLKCIGKYGNTPKAADEALELAAKKARIKVTVARRMRGKAAVSANIRESIAIMTPCGMRIN
jgi:hypothetical protein